MLNKYSTLFNELIQFRHQEKLHLFMYPKIQIIECIEHKTYYE